MKKELFRMWLIFFPIFFVGYMGMAFLISDTRGKEFDVLEKSIGAVILSALVPLGIIAGGLLIPRSKYLESNDINKPSYKMAGTSVIDSPQGFDFGRLKTEISDKWVLTFSNDEEKVLKFRTKLSYFKGWGVAAWLKYDAGKLFLECFPMSSIKPNKYDRKSLQEIEQWFEAL